MPLKIRAHVFVSGFVQGVFFRQRTRQIACRHNVTGWVRNLADGRVEAVLEGEKNDVETVLAFCRKGPPGAIVKDVKVIWKEPTGEFKDFQIRY
ncbi:MAG: acylphosphatase [Candidatus Bathyarchaeia archaeon]